MLGLSFLEWAAGAGLGAKSAVDRQAATDADAYRLNGKPISAGDFMRHKTRDTAGNSAERIMLERKHLDLAKPGLREWVAGSIHGAGFQSLRPLVRVSHLVDVSNPDPGKWHYLRLGDMQKAVTLSNNSLSSCPIPAVVAQTKAAYLDVLQTGQGHSLQIPNRLHDESGLSDTGANLYDAPNDTRRPVRMLSNPFGPFLRADWPSAGRRGVRGGSGSGDRAPSRTRPPGATKKACLGGPATAVAAPKRE